MVVTRFDLGMTEDEFNNMIIDLVSFMRELKEKPAAWADLENAASIAGESVTVTIDNERQSNLEDNLFG